MKLVIDIPDKVKTYLDQTTTYDREDYYVQHFSLLIADAIKNGIPLLKQHGDLIDRDELKTQLPAPIEDEYKAVYRIIDSMPSVIEADV